MKRILGTVLALVLVVALSRGASAQTYGYSARNPCANEALMSSPSTASISIAATAGTTQLVAAPTGQALFGGGTAQVFICGYEFTISGTTPSFQWAYGTGTNCGTGTTNMTGAEVVTSGTRVQSTVGMYLAAPGGNAVCIVAGGTTPTVGGWMWYVVQ